MSTKPISVIVTGTTGMVGEGVLLECLASPSVSRVLSVARKPCGYTHPKLDEVIVPSFLSLADVEEQFVGYDACFFCAGVSSLGKDEAEYTRITYDTTLHFAETLARLNPLMVFEYISGAGTDSTEQGKSMWARVKGRTENALARLPFRAVYNLRPGMMRPSEHQRHVPGMMKAIGALYPVMRVVLPKHVSTLSQIGRAMIRIAIDGSSKRVLEVSDLNALASSRDE
ncbi:epimerase [Granulicella cerasi]|uniref:Epimerase n=1 Tax=Granulicella cerasi TaxID=741063 RepID=A0ABW1ZAW4_9BACT|nr:epimerase [Granulicella cerasi]